MQNFNPIQLLVDQQNREWQAQRAKTQMTLGKLIEELEKLNPTLLVIGFGELNSYRGFYVDLAAAQTSNEESVESVLQRCRAAMGKHFEGYKGGEFLMGENTPLWSANYGTTKGAMRIVGLKVEGGVVSLKLAEELPDEP